MAKVVTGTFFHWSLGEIIHGELLSNGLDAVVFGLITT
jgi:hypothetical protein